MNPKYGNVSEIVKNETYVGEINFYYFQTIDKFVEKTLIVTEGGKTLLNMTAKPCERKNIQKIGALLKQVMDFSSDKNGLRERPEPVKCSNKIVSFLI